MSTQEQDLRKVTVLKCFSNLEQFKINQQNDCDFYWLGLTDYDEAYNLQTELVNLKKNNRNEKQFFIGLEHQPTLTLGLRAHTLFDSYVHSDLDVKKINRGGLATIHSPGQIVIYPIYDLRQKNISVKKFVSSLFLTTQKALEFYKVQSHIDVCDHPGVYTENGKIAFCGLQISNGITQHGLSLNNSNDLAYFRQIESCGVKNAQLDRLLNHNLNITNSELFKLWSSLFRDYQESNHCENKSKATQEYFKL